MRIEKSILTLYILCFIGFGLPGIFMPDQFAVLLQYRFSNPAGKTEFVAAYGGLIVGLGFYLIYCLQTNIRAGLMCVVITIASLFAGRLIGFFMGGEIDNVQLTFLTLELFTILLVGTILIKGKLCKESMLSQ
jgi:hypothetical protein